MNSGSGRGLGRGEPHSQTQPAGPMPASSNEPPSTALSWEDWDQVRDGGGLMQAGSRAAESWEVMHSHPSQEAEGVWQHQPPDTTEVLEGF